MRMGNLIILLGSIFWPLGLYLTNQPRDFLFYTLPTLIILLSYWFYRKNNKYHLFPLLITPFIDTKLSIFPLLVSVGLLFNSKVKMKIRIFFLFLSLLVLTINFKVFTQQSIFVLEYEKKQEVLRDLKLYPNTFMARVFQNKARIVTDKFSINLTALIDPGNYFFSFHPREGVVNNQNLIKYPFLTIIPVLVGIFNIKKIKYYKFTLIIFLSSILSLSLLETFDRSDFILWFPMTIFFIHGINRMFKSKKNYWYVIFSVAFFSNCLIEFLRFSYLY